MDFPTSSGFIRKLQENSTRFDLFKLAINLSDVLYGEENCLQDKSIVFEMKKMKEKRVLIEQEKLFSFFSIFLYFPSPSISLFHLRNFECFPPFQFSTDFPSIFLYPFSFSLQSWRKRAKKIQIKWFVMENPTRLKGKNYGKLREKPWKFLGKIDFWKSLEEVDIHQSILNNTSTGKNGDDIPPPKPPTCFFFKFQNK